MTEAPQEVQPTEETAPGEERVAGDAPVEVTPEDGAGEARGGDAVEGAAGGDSAGQA